MSALPQAIGQGTTLTIDTGDRAQQVVTTDNPAAAGATVVHVTSFVANNTYGVNTSITWQPQLINKFGANFKPCSPFTVSYPNGASRTYCSPSAATYPRSSRGAKYGALDYLKFDIVYQYDWKTGFMTAIIPEPPELHALYVVQIEPQSYP